MGATILKPEVCEALPSSSIGPSCECQECGGRSFVHFWKGHMVIFSGARLSREKLPKHYVLMPRLACK